MCGRDRLLLFLTIVAHTDNDNGPQVSFTLKQRSVCGRAQLDGEADGEADGGADAGCDSDVEGDQEGAGGAKKRGPKAKKKKDEQQQQQHGEGQATQQQQGQGAAGGLGVKPEPGAWRGVVWVGGWGPGLRCPCHILLVLCLGGWLLDCCVVQMCC